MELAYAIALFSYSRHAFVRDVNRGRLERALLITSISLRWFSRLEQQPGISVIPQPQTRACRLASEPVFEYPQGGGSPVRHALCLLIPL